MTIDVRKQSFHALPSLQGRVSVVTGSTSGIGLGIARSLAAAGATVVLNGLADPEEGRKLARDLAEEFAVDASFVAADMADPASIAALFVTVTKAFGPVDVLVNNAGVQHVARIEEFPAAKWDAILAINLSSAFHTIRAVLPGMRERGRGRIVNIASAHALVASPFKSAYVAAKHGLLGLTRTVALEVAEEGITCNAVCPGYVLTPLVEAQIAGQAREHGIPAERVVREILLAQQPNKRFATTDEIGAVTVFLASDAAASITGVALPVDGGWTAH